MIVNYLGVESFKISHGEVVLALNPVSKNSKHKSANFGADLTLITTNHPDTNGRDTTSRGDKESFVISGPGEYEVKDISIRGFLSESNLGGKKKINTIYKIVFEGITICFLGALSNPDLTSEVKESLEDVDILFVPIGGGEVLDASTAYKLSVALEPSLIIPMHYDEKSLKQFLKEGGEEKTEPVEKLVLKKKDLEGKEGDIVVLKEE